MLLLIAKNMVVISHKSRMLTNQPASKPAHLGTVGWTADSHSSWVRVERTVWGTDVMVKNKDCETKLPVFKSQLCPIFDVWPEQFLILSILQFSGLEYGNSSNITSLTGLLQGLEELIHVKHFKYCLARSKCSVCISSHYDDDDDTMRRRRRRRRIPPSGTHKLDRI